MINIIILFNNICRVVLFTNTPSINTSLSAKYVVGSGVGSRNRSVYRALQRRSSNNAQGMPYRIPVNPIQSESVNCIPVEISIEIIATYDSESTYILNGDQTINECQILTISDGIVLRIPEGHTLTNNGIINVETGGVIDNKNYGSEAAGGTITNSGTITIEPDGIISNSSYGSGAAGGTITNSGTGIITNNGIIDSSNYGIGTAGGTITNSGTITIETGGVIYNGNYGGEAGGYIYTYGGGNTTNNGTIVNTGGTVSTANVLSTCGTGTFTGNAPSSVGTVNTNCPPP
jgi:hypothetical protein